MCMKHLLLMALAACRCSALLAQDPYPNGAPVPNIVKAEYYFDTDPGPGNGTAIALNPAQQINNFNYALTLNGPALTSGIHRLYIRTLDDQGHWSLTATALFDNYPVPIYPVVNAIPNVVAMEYYINNDPGAGNGTPVAVAANADLSNQSVQINLNGLSTATHRLYIRSKDANGKWSLTAYSIFDNTVITPYPSAPPAPAPIAQLEYFIDNDPGFGNATAIAVPAAQDVVNFQFNVLLGGVSQGHHTIYIRSRGNPYSLTAYAEFMLGSSLPVTWLYVKGEAQQQQHIISWATSAEVNASHFTIEHSEDGVHYKAIGEVKATASNNEGASYRFVHDHPSAGWNHYRIVETDLDGATTRSKVITLLNTRTLAHTLVTPNPFTDRLHIVLAAHETARRIIVYSTNGRMVMEQSVSDPQQRFIDLQMGALPAGTYFVHILYTNKEGTYKVVRK